jgi:NTP pyrophosphatase (non-canonical NTP hydrolase)
MDGAVNSILIKDIGLLQLKINKYATEKGFWENAYDKNDGHKLMLMVSELGEAYEGLRHGNKPSEHIPNYTSIEEELADVVIRLLDYAEQHKLRIGEAIIAKMEFNETRPHKHGKKF